MAFTRLAIFVMVLEFTTGRVANQKPQLHSSCVDKSFCIHRPSNYPEYEIETLLSEANWLEIDRTETVPRTSPEAENVCKTKIPNTSQVYVIKDTNGDLRYVVQSKRFKQVVRIVECQHPGPITRDTPINILKYSLDLDKKNVQLGCWQSTTDFKYLVLSADFKKFEIATPYGGIPTCCSFVSYKT